MADVTLVPLTEDEREVFFQEQVAGYVEQQVRDAGWPRRGALDRARAELTPVLEQEFAEAVEQRHQLFSGIGSAGRSVGWLWVKPIDGASRSVYLEQITVAQSAQRQGYGRAILAALEELLARDGIDELRLDVNVGNEAARRFYAAVGYEQVYQDERQCHLRKHITRPSR